MAVAAWNVMGGLDWNALPVVVEMLGIGDVEMLIAQLCVMRDEAAKGQ